MTGFRIGLKRRNIVLIVALALRVPTRVVHGLNATVFAYGSTGSGKTYTMVGTRSEPGLMVLSLNTVFDMIKSDKNSDYFEVTCSYLEVYNEVIYDLLEKSSGHLELTSSGRIQSRE